MRIWSGSGTWDLLERPDTPYDVYVHKTITVAPRPAQGKYTQVGNGWINRVGLTNPGLTGFILDILPQLEQIWADAHKPAEIVISCLGESDADWIELGLRLDHTRFDAIELNLSCPTVEGFKVGDDASTVGRIVSLVASTTTKPIIAKLPPTADALPAQAAEENGAAGVALTNSLGVWGGGLSGRPIRSLALYRVEEAAKVVSIPIIAYGGILYVEDAMTFLHAGATDIGIASANLDPGFSPEAAVRAIRATWVD